MERFWGALLMGVGGLIAALGGICTITVDGMSISSGSPAAPIIGMSLVIGSIPVGIGLMLFSAGRGLWRGSQ